MNLHCIKSLFSFNKINILIINILKFKTLLINEIEILRAHSDKLLPYKLYYNEIYDPRSQ